MQIRLTSVFGIAAAILAAGMLLSIAQAQEKESKKSSKPEVTVTGCLEQGSGEGQFGITGEDGKKYDLSSGRVPLKNHIGHKVIVKGVKRGEQGETAQVRVMSLKMVSKTCQ